MGAADCNCTGWVDVFFLKFLSLLREAFTGRLEPQLCSGCSQTPTFSFASLLLLLPNAICPVFRAVRPSRDCSWSCISWLHPSSGEIRAGTIFFISYVLVLRGKTEGCVEMEHSSWLWQVCTVDPTFPLVQVLPQKTSC